MEGCKK